MAVDPLELFALQPACPGCGTVLRDVPRGFVCVTCNRAFAFPWVSDPDA